MRNPNVIIIGAGIVGLATAYQILRSNPQLKVTILEKEVGPAMHQTGRNSGVVHSGIYYKPGSLKAKNCIAGRKELLSFCDENGVGYQTIHKLIVATRSEELPKLNEIFARGQANGVPSSLIGKERIKEIEPHVDALEAIWIPKCQIIDYKEVAKALCSWLRNAGAEIIFREEVKKIESGRVVGLNGTYQAEAIINCAGLHSDRLALSCSGGIQHQILPFRGEYYELVPERAHLVRGLIYPVPDPQFPFLGVHLTRMVNGKVEAGPNAVLALAREGYRKSDICFRDLGRVLAYRGFWKMALNYWKAGVYEMARSFSKQLFLRDLRRLVPAIEEKDLRPGGCGIRAQVVTREGRLLDDFALLQEKNTIHVMNAPSPAATASFSIGRTIAEKIGCG
ncbi:MAG TPA: L-2-hydroxyglutarate oxidase [Chlamydiales bacterium]|nr:L-2-hydroxyglutarate oxidase [Chlamydiales bacterium]